MPLGKEVPERLHVTLTQVSAPPPISSRPEALNFAIQHYEMSEETKLFTPPKYPEPPKDMYYQVPPRSPIPTKPKPIFPWEAHAPKATRVFPHERSSSPESAPALPEAQIETKPVEDSSTSGTSLTASEGDLWQTYNRGNAWDEMPEIDRYVQAFTNARTGKLHVLPHTSTQQAPGSVVSPPMEGRRRPSMKVTDFPTEIERPSLPVTPAPIRRPSFWGQERDELGHFPAAEGVPKQEEWVSHFLPYPRPYFPPQSLLRPRLKWRCQHCGKQNPVAKLDELQRRQSDILEKGQQTVSRTIPQREMPGSKTIEALMVAADISSSPGQPSKPILVEPGVHGAARVPEYNILSSDASPETGAGKSNPTNPSKPHAAATLSVLD